MQLVVVVVLVVMKAVVVIIVVVLVALLVVLTYTICFKLELFPPPGDHLLHLRAQTTVLNGG